MPLQKTGMAIYNGNAESLKWMEDTGFLLEEGYRFGDNDYERQPYVSPRSIRQEQEKRNQTAQEREKIMREGLQTRDTYLVTD